MKNVPRGVGVTTRGLSSLHKRGAARKEAQLRRYEGTQRRRGGRREREWWEWGGEGSFNK